MEPIAYKELYEQEETHWWYRGMRAISAALLRRYAGKTDGSRFLDAGCGTGGTLQALGQNKQAIGLDFSSIALGYARKRRLPYLLLASTTDIPLASESLQLVTSFDVLYHRGVQDDETALREMYRVLSPGGWLLVRVPAFNALESHHDRVVHTRHRYRTAEMREKLRSAGFSVSKVSYANTLLFPPIALKRIWDQFFPPSHVSSDVQTPNPIVNALLTGLLYVEAWLLRFVDLPWGVSVVALARKPS
jgi:ubiquinone/menaquinone biosynthesis C-methylase UbiE